MLNNKVTRFRRTYCVREDYNKSLYNSKTMEKYTININNDYVKRVLCEILVKHNYKLIECIPKDLYTSEIYNILKYKNKRLFQLFTINYRLPKYTLNIKECYYTNTLYNTETKERYTINISNNHVTKDLCEMLFKYDYNLILCIPKDLHTASMYDRILKKDICFFKRFAMNDTLCQHYLSLIINSNQIPMSRHHPENLRQYTIDNYVTEVSRWPYYLKHVPKNLHVKVFEKLPTSFFTIKTLNELYKLQMDIVLFKKYFKNIKFYTITDPKTGPIISYHINNTHLDDGYGLPTGTGWYDLPSNYLTYNPDDFLYLIDRKSSVSIQEVEICDNGTIEFSDFYTVTVPQFSIIGKCNLFHPLCDQYINCNMNLE